MAPNHLVICLNKMCTVNNLKNVLSSESSTYMSKISAPVKNGKFLVFLIATEFSYSNSENEDEYSFNFSSDQRRFERDTYDNSEDQLNIPSNSNAEFNLMSWWKGMPETRKGIKQKNTPGNLRLILNHANQVGSANSLNTTSTPQSANQTVLNTHGLFILHGNTAHWPFNLRHSTPHSHFVKISTLADHTDDISQNRYNAGRGSIQSTDKILKSNDSTAQTNNNSTSTSKYQTTCFIVTDTCAPIMNLFNAPICSSEANDSAVTTVSTTAQVNISTTGEVNSTRLSITGAVNSTTASITVTVNSTTASITDAVNRTTASITDAVNSTTASVTGAVNKAVGQNSSSQVLVNPVMTGMFFPVIQDLNSSSKHDSVKMQEFIESFQTNLRKDIYNNQIFTATKSTSSFGRLDGLKPVNLHAATLVPFRSDFTNNHESPLNEFASADKDFEIEAMQMKNHQNIQTQNETSRNVIDDKQTKNNISFSGQLACLGKIEISQSDVNIMSSTQFRSYIFTDQYSTVITEMPKDGKFSSRGTLDKFTYSSNWEIGSPESINEKSRGSTYPPNYYIRHGINHGISHKTDGISWNQQANLKNRSYSLPDQIVSQCDKSTSRPLGEIKLLQNIKDDNRGVHSGTHSNLGQKVVEIQSEKSANSLVSMECLASNNTFKTFTGSPSIIGDANLPSSKNEMVTGTNVWSNIHSNSVNPNLITIPISETEPNFDTKQTLKNEKYEESYNSATQNVGLVFPFLNPKRNGNLLIYTEQNHAGCKAVNITEPLNLYEETGKIRDKEYNFTANMNDKTLGSYSPNGEIKKFPTAIQNIEGMISTSLYPEMNLSVNETSNMNNYVEHANLSKIHGSEFHATGALKVHLNESAKYLVPFNSSKNNLKVFISDKKSSNFESNKAHMSTNAIDYIMNKKTNFSNKNILSLTQNQAILNKMPPSRDNVAVFNEIEYSNLQSLPRFKDNGLIDINSNFEDFKLAESGFPTLTQGKNEITYYKYNDSYLAQNSKGEQNLIEICKNVTCQGNNFLAPCCGAKAICPPGKCKGEDFSYLLPIPGYPTTTTPNPKAESTSTNATLIGSKSQKSKIRMPRENSMSDFVRFQLMHGQSAPDSKDLMNALREVNHQSQKINREFHPQARDQLAQALREVNHQSQKINREFHPQARDQLAQAPVVERQIAPQDSLLSPQLVDSYKVFDNLKSSISDSLIHSQLNKNLEEKDKLCSIRNFGSSGHQQYLPESNPYLARLIMNEAEEEAQNFLQSHLKGNQGQIVNGYKTNIKEPKLLDGVNQVDMETAKFSDKVTKNLPVLSAIKSHIDHDKERPYTKLVREIEKLNMENDANDIFDRYSGLRSNFSNYYYLPQVNPYISSLSERDGDSMKLDEHCNNLIPIKMLQSLIRRKRNYDDRKKLMAVKDIQRCKETFDILHNELNDLQKYISQGMECDKPLNKESKLSDHECMNITSLFYVTNPRIPINKY